MKNYKIILLFISLISFTCCKNEQKVKKKTNELKESEVSENSDDCPKIVFNKKLDSTISLKGFYYKCEDLWKQDIEFVFNGKTIYKTDSLLEYKFQDYQFPTLIKNDEYTEIILERDDRPLKNFLEVFKFKKSKLDTIYKIPFFEMEAKDIDKDGVKEFYATLEMIELLGNGKIGYNPILAYEIFKNEIRFDLNASQIANEKVYGKFYGLKIDNSMEFDGNKIENNWP